MEKLKAIKSVEAYHCWLRARGAFDQFMACRSGEPVDDHVQAVLAVMWVAFSDAVLRAASWQLANWTNGELLAETVRINVLMNVPLLARYKALNGASLLTYTCSCARMAAMAAAAAEKNKKSFSERSLFGLDAGLDVASDETDADHDPVARDRSNRLYRAVEKLAADHPTDAEVILAHLRYPSGIEAADALGITPSLFASRLCKARKRLPPYWHAA
ncbi:MAG: hypothetical protein AB7K09_07715 [Planctomycetota bacterium]